MLRRRHRILLGIGILVIVQASAILLYIAVDRARVKDSSRPFAVETLTPRAAPPLAFEHSDRSIGTLASLRGKVVMVHFWATWCRPCREELPRLLHLAGELARTRDFELVAVSVDDEWSDISTFFGGRVPRSVVRPDGSDVHRGFGASTLPDTYIVDTEGNLVVRYPGSRDWNLAPAREQLEATINAHSEPL